MNARRRNLLCHALVLGSALLGLALFSNSPAAAHGRRHGPGGHGAVIVAARPFPRSRFAPPHRIFVGQIDDYRPYYAGQLYFGPHGHFHAVYRFPVRTAFGLVHRPFLYCGGQMIVGAYPPPGVIVNPPCHGDGRCHRFERRDDRWRGDND